MASECSIGDFGNSARYFHIDNLSRSVAIAYIWIASNLMAVCLAEEVTIHVVSPGSEVTDDVGYRFATPERAVATLADIAERSPQTEVRVLLDAGIHHIEQPLTIGRKDVPAHGSVTFVAADPERVVISGGKRITGWTVEEDGVWTTVVPEAANGSWSFRELFVGVQRRSRARHPNEGYLRIARAFDDKRTGFIFNAGDLPETWTEGGELVFLHDWSTSRIPIKSVVHDTQRLTVAFPIGNRADQFKMALSNKVYAFTRKNGQ